MSVLMGTEDGTILSISLGNIRDSCERLQTGLSLSIAEICCYNSSQEEFLLKHMYFLKCTLIKAIILQQECPRTVLQWHSGSEFTRRRLVALVQCSSFTIWWRFHFRQTPSDSNHSDSAKSVALPLFTRCGNGSFQNNPPKNTKYAKT